MGVAVLYPPHVLLQRIRKWGDLNNQEHKRLYEKVQEACDMGAEMVTVGGVDLELLTNMYFN